jgi:Icc protein
MHAVQLLHLTDPHLFADQARRLYGLNTAESLRLTVQAALSEGPAPDAVVVTGDIGDDLSADAYRQFRGALAGCGAPVYCLPGNHDDPALMANLLQGDGFQYCGRALAGGWGLVLLDTHLPGEASGRLSAVELERLEAELRAMRDRPVLVCLHHPPLPVGSAWLDAVGLENGADFLAVVDRHPQVRAVLSGHVHQEFEAQRGAIRLFTTPSTCAQFTPRTTRCVMDRRPPGYRWLGLQPDGTVTTRVGWLAGLVAEPQQEDDARR